MLWLRAGGVTFPGDCTQFAGLDAEHLSRRSCLASLCLPPEFLLLGFIQRHDAQFLRFFSVLEPLLSCSCSVSTLSKSYSWKQPSLNLVGHFPPPKKRKEKKTTEVEVGRLGRGRALARARGSEWVGGWMVRIRYTHVRTCQTSHRRGKMKFLGLFLVRRHLPLLLSSHSQKVTWWAFSALFPTLLHSEIKTLRWPLPPRDLFEGGLYDSYPLQNSRFVVMAPFLSFY